VFHGDANFVEIAGNASEIADVVLIVGGFVPAAFRWVISRPFDGLRPKPDHLLDGFFLRAPVLEVAH
jgi:hypothetical protein